MMRARVMRARVMRAVAMRVAVRETVVVVFVMLLFLIVAAEKIRRDGSSNCAYASMADFVSQEPSRGSTKGSFSQPALASGPVCSRRSIRIVPGLSIR